MMAENQGGETRREFTYRGDRRMPDDGVTHIIVDEGVIEIPDWMFCGMCGKFDLLVHVKISKTVKRIGKFAFCGCNSLQTVEIPEDSQLEEIHRWGFDRCSSLQSITLPSSLRRIHNRAFSEGALQSITLPSSMQSIGENAFRNCVQLTSVVIQGDSQLQFVGEGAFANCERLAAMDLSNCPLLRSIETNAFSRYFSLATLLLPPRLQEIGKDAFYSTSIKTITLPASLRVSGGQDGPFNSCSALTTVKFSSMITVLHWFAKCPSLSNSEFSVLGEDLAKELQYLTRLGLYREPELICTFAFTKGNVTMMNPKNIAFPTGDKPPLMLWPYWLPLIARQSRGTQRTESSDEKRLSRIYEFVRPRMPMVVERHPKP